MNDTLSAQPAVKKGTHWPSLGMLLVSGGGAFLMFTGAAGMAVVGLIMLFSSPDSAADTQIYFSLATTSGLMFLLLLPSTIMAAIRLMGKPVPVIPLHWTSLAARWGLTLVPVLILLAILLLKAPVVAAFILPWFQLVVVAVPIWWLFEFGRKNLAGMKLEQGWGLFSVSVIVTMPVIVLIEIILVGLILGGILGYVYSINPDVFQQVSQSLQRLANTNGDQEVIFRILRPYLNNPAVIVSVLAIASGAIPLLEELMKPMALWVLAGRTLTPAQGFIGGMICGAAFALLESLGALGNPAAGTWSLVAFGRIGTGILHVTASGLVGWGLARAWTEGKYLQLACAYLLAFGLHGVWNFTALLAGFKELAQFSPVLTNQFNPLITISPFIMVLLAAGMVFLLFKFNHTLRDKPEIN